jgi:hypothetical protein
LIFFLFFLFKRKRLESLVLQEGLKSFAKQNLANDFIRVANSGEVASCGLKECKAVYSLRAESGNAKSIEATAIKHRLQHQKIHHRTDNL